MKISVKVIPGSKKVQVIPQGDGLRVYLTAPPVDGKANEALVEALTDYFSVRRSRITITNGLKSRNKVITIDQT